MTQTIIRCEKNRANPYVRIDKRVSEDAALSWKAKGLMSYLLRRPDDWQVRVVDLIKRSSDGETAVRSGLRELERHGYIVRERLADPRSGRFTGVRLTVHERPLPLAERTHPQDRRQAAEREPPQGCDPHVGDPYAEDPRVGHHALLNTESTKTEWTEKEVDEGAARPSAHVRLEATDPVLAQVVALYEQEIGGSLTSMIYDELTDLVGHECREVERWRAAFRASIGARNRWQYTRAIILHPKRSPPKEVKQRGTSNRRSGTHHNGGRRPSGTHGYTLPSREEVERVNREAEVRLRELETGAGPPGPQAL